MDHYRVLIIGAGPAGIAAAAKLLENDVNDLLILEAEDRIGGRVFTTQLDGNLIELGAEWVHGEKDNVVYEIASEFDLVSNSDMSDSIFVETNFYETGNRQVDKNLSREMCLLFNRILYVNPHSVPERRGSLGDYFVNEFKKGVQELKRRLSLSETMIQMFLNVFEKWENSIDGSHSWYETSFPGHFEYWDCDGNKLTIWKERTGYNTLFDILEKKFPYGLKSLHIRERIKLGKEVERIAWNKECTPKTPGVQVECVDGSRYSADQAIVTLPLGMLKERAGTIFAPSLSQEKLSTIQGLGFGTVDKIFVKFPYRWWADDNEGFAFLWSDEEKRNDSSGWISEVIAFHPVRPDSPILRGWIIGEGARRMESLSDDEVIDGCMELFNKFMGFKYKIPRAEVVMRSTWYSNPHFRGSYSCRLVESDKRNSWAAHLAEPEKNANGRPVLLFAGEATHDHFYSTVHGAIESGHREADRLLTQVLRWKEFYRVVIVGAGISGLAAAKALREEGVTDVIVLEAQDAPGGRLKSVKVGEDWLELGAQWIHGDRNDVFEVCRENDLVTEEHSSEGEGLYLREDGSGVSEELVREIDDVVKDILERCEEYAAAAADDDDVPPSVGHELAERFDAYLAACEDSDDVRNAKRDLFDWHVRFQLIDNSCDDLRDLSARGWGLYRFCGGNDYVNFKSGYKSLVDVLARDANLACSAPVDVVRWKRIARSGESSAQIVCNNGAVISADYVIVTTSLGYLKVNHERMFSPTLPEYLTEAIHSIGYGVLAKIFLIYDELWWDPEVRGFQLVWSHRRMTEEAAAGGRHWALDLTGFDVIVKGKPVLLGWVGGRGARIVEAMTEDEVGTESTDILRRFTGNPGIPLPDRVLKSNWCGNEFVRGGYSHITVSYDENRLDGSSLARPAFTNVFNGDASRKKPTILLAGEAVHQTHFSTVHGAYESGVGQARVVARDIRHASSLP